MKRPAGKILMLTALAVLLAASPAINAGSGSKGSGDATKRAIPPHPVTVEAGPPLDLDFHLVNLQKNARGGVATLSMETRATDGIDPVTLIVDLPERVTFTDGSRSRSWSFPLAAGADSEITADLLVAEDGKYVIRAQATGTLRGKPMHRGLAFRLLVGVEETPPPVRDGAIEYPGVAGGGI